jgi:hypothetical protein
MTIPSKAALRAELEAALANYRGPVKQCPAALPPEQVLEEEPELLDDGGRGGGRYRARAVIDRSPARASKRTPFAARLVTTPVAGRRPSPTHDDADLSCPCNRVCRNRVPLVRP